MNKTSVAGRGVIFLMVSKAYFIISGYAIHFGLARLLGKELFGLFGIVNTVVGILNAVLITGTIQMVSKFVSQDEKKSGAVLKSALQLQVLVGGGLFALYYLSAPLSARFFKDQGLIPYFRLSGLIVICYAFYAIYMGYINGRRKFGLQACLDMGYSTLKMTLMLCLVAAGIGVAGAIGGFALAAFSLLVIAMFVVGRRPGHGSFSKGALFNFEAFIMFFALIMYLLLQTDLWLLKRLSPHDISYIRAAYYYAAQKIAFIPYQAIIAITFVLFPYVSRLSFIDDKIRLKEYIRQALRYSLIILVGLAALLSANSPGMIRILFPAGYEAGGPALSLLVFGIVFFSLLYINATIISGSGRPAHSLLIALGTWVVDILLNYSFIPRFGMMGAASSTTAAMFLGLVVSAIYVKRRFGTYLSLASFLRVGAAGGAVAALSLIFPCRGFILVAKLIALSLVYLGFLRLIGEIGKEDISRIKATLKRS